MNFNITGDTSNYMNSFFSGLNSTDNTSSFLTDWYSVRNGSYYKVAKKYYSENGSQTGKNTSVSDEKQLELVKNSAEASVNAISKLMDDSLYTKVKKTDDEGNVTYDYDRDAIMSNVKSFVEKYNSLIEDTGELDDKTVLKNGVRLVNQTDVYGAALGRVGINIKEDNTLELDEDVFKEADMVEVKSLFTGNVSFATNMQTKFLQIYSNASGNNKNSNYFYNSSGNYKKSVANMFDSVL